MLRKTYGTFVWGCAVIVMFIDAEVVRAGPIVLFNNYGSAYTYETNVGFNVFGATSPPGQVHGPIETANEFTVLHTAKLLSVYLGISNSGLGLPSNIIVELRDDNQGAPGTVLESFSFVNELTGYFGIQNPPLVATSITHPVLHAGTNYWIVAAAGSSDTNAAWNLNNQRVFGAAVRSGDGGSTWVDNGNPTTLGAFEVFGVPEPSALTLVAIGGCSLAVGTFRRRRNQIPI